MDHKPHAGGKVAPEGSMDSVGAMSTQRRRRRQLHERQAIESFMPKADVVHHKSITLYSEKPIDDIEQIYDIETMYDLSRYEWFKTGSTCTRLRALIVNPIQLDMDREEILMLLEILDGGIKQDARTSVPYASRKK
jgi:hypothetical protein